MKKKLLVLVAAVAALSLSAAALTGCGGGEKAADQNEAANPTTLLNVGFDAEYPPYGYMADDGTYTGFDLELAAEVCARNGWEFVATPIDWDSKDQMLESGQINCIWNGFTYEGREADYAWSKPYMQNGQVVVVKADNDTIKTPADLADKVVLTQAGSTAHELLESEDYAELTGSFKELQTVADYNNAMMQLESGAVDAVVCDLSIAAYQMAANPDKFIQLDEAIQSESYAVGFALGQEEMADAVSATLLEMYNDGFVASLCEKYADQGITIDKWLIIE